MSDSTGLKFNVVTKNPQIIPGSYNQFLVQRKDWLDLLLKSDEEVNKENIQADSTHEIQKLAEIKSILPNPAKETFTISFIANKSGRLDISLISTQGVEIATITRNAFKGNDYYETISTLYLPEGIYFIVLSFDKAIQDAGKIVIRK